MKLRCYLLLCSCWPLLVQAQQPSVQLESRVSGNQALPRVVNILPWRQPADISFTWQPEPAIATDLFQPLRRDEYLRSLRYREAFAAPPESEPEPLEQTELP